VTKSNEKSHKINKEDVDLIFDTCYSICRECAIIHGAKSPYDNYICTAWSAKCDVCKDLKSCVAVSDWRWPGKHWEWID